MRKGLGTTHNNNTRRTQWRSLMRRKGWFINDFVERNFYDSVPGYHKDIKRGKKGHTLLHFCSRVMQDEKRYKVNTSAILLEGNAKRNMVPNE